MQTKDVDVERAINDLGQMEPLLMITGSPGIEAQFQIYIEGKHTAEVTTLRMAIAYLMACYYIFNICYPKSDLLFLFFQSCIFKIDTIDNPPPTLARLIHSLST